MSQSFRWITVDVYTVFQFTPAQIIDLITFGEPDGFILTIPSGNSQPDIGGAHNTLREHFGGIIWLPDTPEDAQLELENETNTLVGTPHAKILRGTEYLFVSSDELMRASDGNGGFVFANDVDVHVDTSALETTLVGLDSFIKHQSESDSEYAYVSTQLDADYYTQWNDTAVGGIGMIQSGGMKKIPIIDCHPDASYTTTLIKHTELGLRKIEGIGYKTRHALQEAGYETQHDIATAEPIFMADDADIQPWRAERIVKSARSYEENEMLFDGVPDISPLPDDALIVTGMVNPPNNTRCWQLFVSDMDIDSWEVFYDTECDETGSCYQEFILWYLSDGEHRPVVVWDTDMKRLISNGIQRYAPEYLSLWESCDVYTVEDIIDDRSVFMPIYTDTIGNVGSVFGDFGGLWENWDVWGNKFTHFLNGGPQIDREESVRELLQRHKVVTTIYKNILSSIPEPKDDEDDENERDEEYEAMTLEGKRRKLLSN